MPTCVTQFEGYETSWIRLGGYRTVRNIQRLDRLLEAEGDSTTVQAAKQADVLMLFLLSRDELRALRNLGTR